MRALVLASSLAGYETLGQGLSTVLCVWLQKLNPEAWIMPLDMDGALSGAQRHWYTEQGAALPRDMGGLSLSAIDLNLFRQWWELILDCLQSGQGVCLLNLFLLRSR